MIPAPAPAAPAQVPVTFVVDAPPSTPAGSVLWISGNLPSLGSWNGAGLRLEPLGGGRHAATVTLEQGGDVEFKVTRGGWETVEKAAAGGEMANRRFRAVADDTVRVRVAAWRDQTGQPVAKTSTLTGTIRRHPLFPSRRVRPRDVLVYLPPGYGADTTQRYPVFYFHDGNNVFDAATSFAGVEWGVDETAERLIRSGALRPFIAVAVYNTPDRAAEYTPVADGPRGGGHAGDYARYLLEELMPFVDRTYRTRREPAATGVVGSSLGGIVSLYLALEHPERFGLVGCISPAAWWAGHDIVRRAARARPGLRIWLDIGTEEGTQSAGRSEWLEDARALSDTLVHAGYRLDADLHYEEIEGGVHHERAWAARVDRMLLFLLGGPRPGDRPPGGPPQGREDARPGTGGGRD
jgi:predicted alpha/beta superfamily hydrolase